MNIFKYCALSVAIGLQATFNFTNEHLDQVKNFDPRERSIFIFSCMHMDKHDSGRAVSYTPAYLLDGMIVEFKDMHNKANANDIDIQDMNSMLKECVFPAIQHLDLPEEIWDLEFCNIALEKLEELEEASSDDLADMLNIYMGDIAVLIAHCFNVKMHLDTLGLCNRGNELHNRYNINTLHFLDKIHENLSVDLIKIDSKNLCDKFIENKKSLDCRVLYININNGTHSSINNGIAEIVTDVSNPDDTEIQYILGIISQICIDKLSLITIDHNVYGGNIYDLSKNNPEFINMIEENIKLPLQPNDNMSLTFHKSIFDFSGMLESLMGISPEERSLFMFECIHIHNISQKPEYYIDDYKFDPLSIYSGAISEINELIDEDCIYVDTDLIINNASKILQNTNMPKEIWRSSIAHWESDAWENAWECDSNTRSPHFVTRLAIQASKVKLEFDILKLDMTNSLLPGNFSLLFDNDIGAVIEAYIQTVYLPHNNLDLILNSEGPGSILAKCHYKQLVIDLDDEGEEEPYELDEEDCEMLMTIIEEQTSQNNLEKIVILSKSENKDNCHLSNTELSNMITKDPENANTKKFMVQPHVANQSTDTHDYNKNANINSDSDDDTADKNTLIFVVEY